MEKINRNNYEVFFIDYLDGTLNDRQIEELFDFLEENADLKEELISISGFQLEPDQNIEFPNKAMLKKNKRILKDSDSPVNEMCIARIEGDMTVTEEKRFDSFVKSNPDILKSYELYKKTKNKPDYSIVYPYKDKLKKQKTPVIFIRGLQRTLAYAASLILLVSIYINYSTNYSNDHTKYLGANHISNYKNLKISDSESTVPTPNTFSDNTNYSSIEYNSFSINPSLKPNSNNVQQEIKPIKPIFASLVASENSTYQNLMDVNIQTPSSNDLNTQQTSYLAEQPKSSNEKQGLPLTFGKNEPFSLLDIADLGFQGINKLTGKKWELKRFYNDNGELKKLALRAESFAFSTNINNK